ncbi:vitelline membrane outer layer protein 1-like [Paroedura picta]|uniref:vitelline membrane outer layer protein 1-like n=1 Tax=Paroedura picta TaxID=143630 RepID=UPI00405618C1
MHLTGTSAIALIFSCCLWDAKARKFISTLTVNNGLAWGKWGPEQFCPRGYATGFWLKVEPFQGSLADSTSLNGIRLQCSDGSTITSSVVHYSHWTARQSCKSGYLTSFSLRVTPYRWIWDDTAANNIKFKCSDGTEVEGSGHPWGAYGAWSQSCQKGGICGIQTRVEVHGPNVKDHTGLEDVKFFCCN